MGLPLTLPESKRQPKKWKHIDYAIKKKFWAPLSVNEGYADILMKMKRCIIIDFTEEGTTVNSAFYCQIFC